MSKYGRAYKVTESEDLANGISVGVKVTSKWKELEVGTKLHRLNHWSLDNLGRFAGRNGRVAVIVFVTLNAPLAGGETNSCLYTVLVNAKASA